MERILDGNVTAMSTRLTKAWTRSAAEAYGASGAKGREGELFLIEQLRKQGLDVIDKESERSSQLNGIDLIVFVNDPIKGQKSYTIDVKHNQNEKGTFFIEVGNEGWLFNPSHISELIIHVCVKTGWTTRYERKKMIEYALKNNLKSKARQKDKLYMMTLEEVKKVPFISRRQYGNDI